jgi:hypothetical protein
MNANRWSVWGAAIVMAAALSVGSAGNADARLGSGIRIPVDDTQEVNGVGANHQVSGDFGARRIGHMLILPLRWLLPDDWDGLRLPVYQTVPED